MVEPTTPFEVIFAAPGIAERYFPRIGEEAAAHGAALPGRDRFLTLPGTGELLAEITPATGAGGPQIALLAFHAFRRWQEGGADVVLEAAALAELLARPVIGEWQLTPPAPAGYVRLPRHLLWVAGEPAEPVDGFFWVVDESSGNALDVLLVLGMHRSREGMTVIELASGPLPPGGNWGDVQVRTTEPDFASVLPGGSHLLGLSSAGEVLKLVSRIFWQQGHG